MGIGISIFLLAVGAVLAFAVDAQASGVNLETIGYILMLVGGLGLLVSALFLASWAPLGSSRRVSEVVDEDVDGVRTRHRRIA